MSRAFIKEDAGDPDELPDRHQSASPNYVTPEGLAAFQQAEIDKWWPIIKSAGIGAQAQ